MISDLDRTIEQLLKLDFGSPLPFDLSFTIPDKNFSPVTNTKNTLNCYLYDIRDDRELRSVAPILTRNSDGTVTKDYPPARIKLTYCITAWSPAQLTPGVEPAIDEHTLLGQVLMTLLRYPTLPPGVLVGALVGQNPPLPSLTALQDNSKVGGDFWTAIGGQMRPSLDYSVTISMAYQPVSSSPMVTLARLASVQIGGDQPGTGDGFLMVAGTVTDSQVLPNAIAGAWVRVNQTGQTFVTDANGHFIVDHMAAGNYTLTVRAVGFKEGNRAITVPQPDGNYDVSLVPL
jgi:hypothetical protein